MYEQCLCSIGPLLGDFEARFGEKSKEGYDGPIRQLTISDLRHKEPTFLLTNQMHRAASTLIECYAKRMVIENSIAAGIDFFHMDALSSAVVLKITYDLQLALTASSLYRLLGA